MKTIGKLKREQYWKWKATVNELLLKEEQLKTQECKLALLQARAELAAIHVSISKQSLDQVRQLVESAKKEYQNNLDKMEKSLGFSIRDSVIDEITLEVMKEE